MGKRDISPQHRVFFNAVLSKIDGILPLDFVSINETIGGSLGNKFPKEGNGGALLATTSSVALQFRPFQPLVFLTSPPHHLGAKVPLFEFKMAKIRGVATEELGYFAPVCWSVFPDGQQVLIVSGLRLSTPGGKSSYEKGSLLEDRAVVNPALRAFMTDIIQLFPVSTGSKEEAMVFDAIADLKRTN
jgi:hypothetical protein